MQKATSSLQVTPALTSEEAITEILRDGARRMFVAAL